MRSNNKPSFIVDTKAKSIIQDISRLIRFQVDVRAQEERAYMLQIKAIMEYGVPSSGKAFNFL